MHTYRNYLQFAVFAALAACARPLAAQGGRQAVRPAAAPVEGSLLAPARIILRHLVGHWRFEIRFAGNFDGPPDASGTRVVDTLFGDLRLQWTEVYDDSELRGQGVIGFDPRTGRFYSSAVHSAGSGAEFLTGTGSLVEPVVTFSPAAPERDRDAGRASRESFTWTMVDPDHFIWAPLDRGWRAVFTRVP
jgi:hypothetical protein